MQTLFCVKAILDRCQRWVETTIFTIKCEAQEDDNQCDTKWYLLYNCDDCKCDYWLCNRGNCVNCVNVSCNNWVEHKPLNKECTVFMFWCAFMSLSVTFTSECCLCNWRGGNLFGCGRGSPPSQPGEDYPPRICFVNQNIARIANLTLNVSM